MFASKIAVGGAWIPAALFALGTGCARSVPGAGEPGTRSLNGPAGQLFVDDGGRGGMPVVFVHSFAGSSAHWSAQLAHLRPTRRAIALDLRGHGQSDAPAGGGYAVQALASDIGAVVDQLGLQRFVLVGHSMGGAAAIAYTRAEPERVAGLVLVGTPGKASPQLANQVLSSMQANYEQVSEGYWKTLLTGAQPKVEAQIRNDLKRVPRAASLAVIEGIFAYDPLPALRSYERPKLIIDTSHGEGPDALHNQVPEIPRRVITGTSHWPHLDKPAEFNRMLDEFLATLGHTPSAGPWEAARQRGVEFRAVGQEPGWVLDIDQGRSLGLSADYGNTRATTPAPDPTRDRSGNITYHARTEAHDLTVVIQPTPCQDTMSGEAFTHTVTVRLDGQEMKGCGRVLNTEELTGSYWRLTELNGTPSVAGSAENEPHLRLAADGSTATGSTGCNSLRAPFQLDNDRLRFGAMITTKRACVDDRLNRQEQEFVRVLQDVDRFTVQRDVLTLHAGNRAVARFTAEPLR